VGEDRIEAAAEALARGRLVVLPTDTVYGVAASPRVPGATARLFEAKRRTRRLTLPVLVAGREQVATVAVLDRRADLLADRFWPGGLTVILPRTPESLRWDLGDKEDTVGVRVPDHPVARGLLAVTGPLAVTSANRSGEPTPSTCRGVREALGEAVSVYLCDDPAPGRASTVVDLTAAEPEVVREGAIPAARVLAALD
jgi:L-threonylcarbamoyladenylate synthase